MFRSRYFHLLLSLSISLLLILWLYLTVDWHEVAVHLRGVHFWAVLPTFLVTVLHYIIRAWRWRYLLVAGEKVGVVKLFDSLMVGNLATFVLPFRAGEFVRPFLLSRIAEPSFIKGFVSVILERFFDLSTILLLFAVLMIKLPHLDPWVYRGAYSLTLLAVLILGFIVLGSYRPDWIRAISSRCLAWAPVKLRQFFESTVEDLLAGAAVLRVPGGLFRVIVLSALVWGLALLQHYLFFYFLEIEPQWWLSLSVMVVIALAVAAPSAPGFIGVFQAGWIGGLAIFDISREVAVAYSIVTHIFLFLLVIMLGVISLFKYGFNLGQLMDARRISSSQSGSQ